jgi:hypothetical protein
VARHAYGQGLGAAQDEPRIEGGEDRARRVLVVLQPLRVALSFTTATPPTLSEWPFRNFVVECTTMSAPSSSGRWKNGLMNVLSTTRRARRRRAASARAAMSQTFMRGLVGVSIQSIANSPAALSKAPASLASRNANSTPY